MLLKNLSGHKFNSLHVLKRIENKGKCVQWLCRCECGNKTITTTTHLITGHTKSCGCLKIATVVTRSFKHGHKTRANTSREYQSWSGAKARCFRTSHRRYKDWGGRGITMCPDWANSFDAFFTYMGPCPAGKSLDRFPNNNGNYEPGNVRWASPTEQTNNQRPRKRGYHRRIGGRHFIEYAGQRLTIGQWAQRLGIPYGRLQTRIFRKWPLSKALCPMPSAPTPSDQSF